jgi:hypothetical protein
VRKKGMEKIENGKTKGLGYDKVRKGYSGLGSVKEGNR